jgi:ATP-binding cassette subfamily B protein
MMLFISPMLTLVGLVTMPAGILLSATVIRHSQRFYRGQQRSLGTLNGFIEETYNGHIVVKAFGREKASAERFETLNDELYHNAWKAQFFAGIIMPVTMFLTNLGYVFIAVLGGRLVLGGTILIGDVQAMIQYLRRITHPVSMVTGTSASCSRQWRRPSACSSCSIRPRRPPTSRRRS